MKELEVQERIADALAECLRDVPFVAKRVLRERSTGFGSGVADLAIDVTLPEGPATLLVEARSSGEPRHVRAAVHELRRAARDWPGAYPVLVAPYITSASAEICCSEGVGYVDLAGNCRLVFDDVYIERTGRPNPFARKRSLRSVFHPKGERVLRVLLSHPGRTWTLQELADEAQVSLGHVFNVKESLLDEEWALQDSDGLRVAQPLRAIREWGKSYDFGRNVAVGYYSFDLRATEERLAEACRSLRTRCALTQFSGAERLAPFARYRRVSAYVEAPHDEVASRLGLRPVATGPNVHLLRPYDEGVFYDLRCVGNACIVSPIQLYLDLRTSPARGEEAAEHLLETEIAPRWTV